MVKSFGVVKWYGGVNAKTRKENKFGFIHDISGSDVFLHESSWNEEEKPFADELIMYSLEEAKGKISAKNAKKVFFIRF